MAQNTLFESRIFRVYYWDASPGFISAASAAFESQLRHLIQVELVRLNGLSESVGIGVDLLIISAIGVDEEDFLRWLKSIFIRLPKNHGIYCPTIIIADTSAHIQRDLLKWAVSENWYFDVINPLHFDSLPVRVANFLRIHDHLHEIQRMNRTMEALDEKVKDLEVLVSKTIGGDYA